MRPIIPGGIVIILVLLAASCREETPTRAFESDDQYLASIVAAISGEKSGGLVASLMELSAGPVADSLFGHRPRLRAVRSNSGVPLRRLALQRGVDASSTLDVRYLVRSPRASRIARDEPMAVRVATDGVHDNGAVRVIASSDGEILLSGLRTGRPVRISGEIHVNGTPSFSSSETRPFTDAKVALVWKDLIVSSVPNGSPIVTGSVEVTVAANGDRGMLVRSGTLAFNGSRVATLKVAGKQYQIDIDRGRLAN